MGTDCLIRAAHRGPSGRAPSLEALIGGSIGTDSRVVAAKHVMALGFALALPGLEDDETLWPSPCERLARLGW